MCGRFSLTASAERVAEAFSLSELEAFPPRYNIAPSQPILAVTGGPNGESGAAPWDRQARLVRWGLIPGWARDLSKLPLLFNARSETAATKSTFRGAMRHRRCLIPASGFYEWKKAGSRKSKGGSWPYFLRPAGDPIAFAGLWETWMGPNGEELESAAILTTEANETLSAIHPRMPVIVRPQDHARWLDTRGAMPRDVADILCPAPDDFFEPIAIGQAINRATADGPEVQVPVRGGKGGSSEPATPSDDSGKAQPRLL